VEPLTVLVHSGEVLGCRSGMPHPMRGLRAYLFPQWKAVMQRRQTPERPALPKYCLDRSLVTAGWDGAIIKAQATRPQGSNTQQVTRSTPCV